MLVAHLQALGVWKKCVRRHTLLYRKSIESGLFKLPQAFKMPV